MCYQHRTSTTCIQASSRGAEKSPNRLIPFLSPSACNKACMGKKFKFSVSVPIYWRSKCNLKCKNGWKLGMIIVQWFQEIKQLIFLNDIYTHSQNSWKEKKYLNKKQRENFANKDNVKTIHFKVQSSNMWTKKKHYLRGLQFQGQGQHLHSCDDHQCDSPQWPSREYQTVHAKQVAKQ